MSTNRMRARKDLSLRICFLASSAEFDNMFLAVSFQLASTCLVLLDIVKCLSIKPSRLLLCLTKLVIMISINCFNTD